ncbi:hypothetical protein PAXRUDRAFT_835991, partial [Paxillus rubicundulus Ve08.2h10]
LCAHLSDSSSLSGSRQASSSPDDLAAHETMSEVWADVDVILLKLLQLPPTACHQYAHEVAKKTFNTIDAQALAAEQHLEQMEAFMHMCQAEVEEWHVRRSKAKHHLDTLSPFPDLDLVPLQQALANRM